MLIIQEENRYFKCKKSMVLINDLSKLIDETPCEVISELYWDNMGNYYLGEPLINLEILSFPGQEWDGKRSSFQEYLNELLDKVYGKVHKYISKWNDEELIKNIVNHEYSDWTIKEIKDYLNGKSDDEELCEFIHEYWLSVEIVNTYSIEWFFIRLLEYNEIIKYHSRGTFCYTGTRNTREEIIDEILS